jgi:hypothetical protein
MQCTTNFGALVIDKTQPTADIENCLFHYKAMENLPTFRVGKPYFFFLSDILDELSKRKQKNNNKDKTIKII